MLAIGAGWAGLAAVFAFVATLMGVGMLREAGPGTAGRRWGVALTALGAAVFLVFALLWAEWIIFGGAS